MDEAGDGDDDDDDDYDDDDDDDDDDYDDDDDDNNDTTYRIGTFRVSPRVTFPGNKNLDHLLVMMVMLMVTTIILDSDL